MDQIPAVVEYVTFDINQIPPEVKKSEELRNYVLLKTQGSCVELIESPKIALSMFIFNVLHQVCPEVILKLANEKRYIIYNHNVEPVIHPVDVKEIFPVKEEFNSKNLYSEEELHINLEEIWHEALEHTHTNTLEVNIPKALEIIQDKIHRINFTYLIGNVPLLLVLAAQHMVGNNTKQLYYQRSLDSLPKRIK